jgi:cold-inducible RNA-binding protein
MMKNLFVGNMSFQTTEGDLRTLFEPYGEITRIHIVQDRETGQARGFAFVEVADDAEAAKAISALNGKEVAGRALKVNEATPRPERSGGGSRGGGGGGFRDRGDRGRGGRY